LLNKNVSDQGSNLDYVFSQGNNIGLAINIYPSKKIGLGIELNNSTVNQDYKGDLNGGFQNTTTMKFLDIPLLLKVKSGASGFYFEIGPKLSYLLTAKQSFSLGSSSIGTTPGTIKSDFNSAVISGVIGVGGRFNVANKLTISAGLRFNGSINDATVSSSKIGIAGAYANLKDNYKKTTLAAGQLQLGLLYRIGK
jgi:hypothetical protein